MKIGIVSLVTLAFFNTSYAELPERFESNPPEHVTGDSSIKRYCDDRAEEQRKAKRFLEMFLKCNGENGNASMSFEYGDPNRFYIQDGKCKYSHGGHG